MFLLRPSAEVPFSTCLDFLTQIGRIRRYVVSESRGCDVGTALRGSLCVPNFLFDGSQAGDTAAGTPANGRISQQSIGSGSKSPRFVELLVIFALV